MCSISGRSSTGRTCSVFTSAPLEQDLEVTGPIKAVIYASTDGPDTDFTAKLCDVYPDGRSWNLCDGIVRGTLPERSGCRPIC